MPINYKKYPTNWKTEVRPAILKRAKDCCEFCGVENYSIGYRDSNNIWYEIEQSFVGDMQAQDAKEIGYKIIKIVLTVAHLDHDVTNNDPSNLKALCQKCHLNYDLKYHQQSRKKNRIIKSGQLNLLTTQNERTNEQKTVSNP